MSEKLKTKLRCQDEFVSYFGLGNAVVAAILVLGSLIGNELGWWSKIPPVTIIGIGIIGALALGVGIFFWFFPRH